MAEPDAAVTVTDADQARRMVRALSPRDQEVIQLLGWDGLSVEEVAMVLDCSEAVVRTRLRRARERLTSLQRLEDLTTEGPADDRRRLRSLDASQEPR